MHLLATSTLAWIGFCLFILAMLAIDLGVFNRRPHEITFKNAAIWSGIWIALALIFSALLFHPLGWELFGSARHQKGLEFLTGYIIELALSIDNLFIFLLIRRLFAVYRGAYVPERRGSHRAGKQRHCTFRQPLHPHHQIL